MSRFWWVRHGPTHARGFVGWSDVPADLSDHAALSRLRARLPAGAVIVSSDLRRCVATAEALGGTLAAQIPELREMRFGAWELRRHDEISAETPELARDFWTTPGDVRPPGGESWNDLSARVGAAVDRLAAAHPDRDIVAVAHFGVILTQVQRARAITPHAALAQHIAPLSLTRIARDGAGWRLIAVNEGGLP